jgi:hypothetical protein
MYCTCCGLCCKRLDKIELPEEYKYLDNGSGICKFLNDNRCMIYKERPLICNSNRMYALYYCQFFETMEKFEEFLKTICHQIQGEGLDERLRKNIKCD